MALFPSFISLLSMYSLCLSKHVPWKESGWGKQANDGEAKEFTKQEIKAYIDAGIYCPCGNKKIQACGNKWFGGCGGSKNFDNICPANPFNDYDAQNCNDGCFIHDYYGSCEHGSLNKKGEFVIKKFKMAMDTRVTTGAKKVMNTNIGKCHSGSTCIVIDDETEQDLQETDMYISITPQTHKHDRYPNRKKLIFAPDDQQFDDQKLCWGSRFDKFVVTLWSDTDAIHTFPVQTLKTSVNVLKYKSIDIKFKGYFFYNYAKGKVIYPLPFGTGYCIQFDDESEDEQLQTNIVNINHNYSVFWVLLLFVLIIVLFCSAGFLCGGIFGYFVFWIKIYQPQK